MVDDLLLTKGTRIGVAPQVVFRQIDNETVLINLETERMFTLNSTGTHFWQLLAEGQNIEQISKQLQADYMVDEQKITKEIDDLLRLLEDEGLVTVG